MEHGNSESDRRERPISGGLRSTKRSQTKHTKTSTRDTGKKRRLEDYDDENKAIPKTPQKEGKTFPEIGVSSSKMAE